MKYLQYLPFMMNVCSYGIVHDGQFVKETFDALTSLILPFQILLPILILRRWKNPLPQQQHEIVKDPKKLIE